MEEVSMSRNKFLALAVALLVAALAVTGSVIAAGSPLPAMRKALARAEAVPVFKAHMPPIDVSSLRGKKVMVIPFASSPQNVVIDAAMESVGSKTGVSVTACDNHGMPSEWSTCLQQALSEKMDAVVLNADPSVVGPQLEALKAAHIPVLQAHFFPEGTKASDASCKGCSAGITAVQPAPFKASYRLMADWAIVDSSGKADAIVTAIPGLAPTIAFESQIKAEFAKCKGCKFKVVNVSVADIIGTGFQTAIASALNRDPKVNYVLDEVGVAVPATVSALNIAGRKNVKVAGFGGTTGELGLLEQKTAMAMDAGEPNAWVGYASMDAVFRLLLGKPTDPNATPVRVFTRANIAQVGKPPSATKGYGNSYIGGYEQLWGIG
jgi:ribose transport system substrate-binding protein